MKKSKLDYSAPEAEVFVVRVEKGLCQSPLTRFNSNHKTEYFDESSDIDDL